MQIARALGDRQLEGTCLRKLAGTFNYQGLPQDALKRATESLAIFQQLGDPVGIYKAEQHIAWSYAYLGRWKEALEKHQGAIKQAEKLISMTPLDCAKGHRYLADVYRMCRLFECQ